jgi:hypothetical protein
MQSYWSTADRARRQAIITELQERIRRIRTEIQLQEDKKKSAIEEYDRNIAEYTEDLEFTITLLHEFGAREEDAYTYESSAEEEAIVPTATAPARQGNTPRVSSADRQEAKDKARAWHLDRTRIKAKSTKK